MDAQIAAPTCQECSNPMTETYLRAGKDFVSRGAFFCAECDILARRNTDGTVAYLQSREVENDATP